MKKYSLIWATGILSTILINKCYAQQDVKIDSISPYYWAITDSKTSNLVFPFAILSVDKGSKDILVQKAKGVENILQIKAGKENFEETNLTVITSDGTLYSYILHYVDKPTNLNIRYLPQKMQEPDAIFSDGSINLAPLKADAGVIMDKGRMSWGITDKKYGMQFRVTGIFIRDQVMYLKIDLKNASNIRYDFEKIHIFISDKTNVRRTASQEVELKPLYIHQETKTVVGGSEQVFVYALPKFTIPDEKKLNIQVLETNGGRHLALKIPNRKIVQAKTIRDAR